ncbi:PIG-L family deacetylase [Nocardia sp. NPDC050712]|uniref:PIG-L deacetylase family protein n=1 Tax=Nocardia sp. NPDC050712 TaxID=3155518 RepID=UPI0033D022CF
MAPPVIDLRSPGTDDALWATWRERSEALPLAEMTRLTVVAAHPDDEVLGAGGLIAAARARGVEVALVTVTDGEGSHPGSPTYSPPELAEVRAREVRRAAAELGADRPIRWGIPDGRVAESEAEVADRLHALLAAHEAPGSWCAATWRHDGHPDHEALGRAAATAAERAGVRLLEYPIWMWHWATPDHPRLAGTRPALFDLPATAHAAKCRAIGHFPSQTQRLSPAPQDAPILPEHILRRFTGPTETYFR